VSKSTKPRLLATVKDQTAASSRKSQHQLNQARDLRRRLPADSLHSPLPSRSVTPYRPAGNERAKGKATRSKEQRTTDGTEAGYCLRARPGPEESTHMHPGPRPTCAGPVSVLTVGQARTTPTVKRAHRLRQRFTGQHSAGTLQSASVSLSLHYT
jgi:hypothetical protein